MILLLGGSGYLGSHFCRYLTDHEISFRALGREQLPYHDVGRLEAAIAAYRPRFVINCAGFTGRPNVDACERYQAECLAANPVLPANLAEACQRLDLPWGHVSTGCIYTGIGPNGRGFTEVDPPNFTFRQNNCSFYSGCKALAEEMLAKFDRCFIWRLRIPFENMDNPRNYISKLLNYARLLEARNSLSYLDEVVQACVDCWQRQLPFGIYNLTNGGSVLTSDVVRMIQKHGLTSKEFRFFCDEREFMQRAAITRRSNCVLDNHKALAAGLRLTPVDEALERCLSTWIAANKDSHPRKVA
jgi:dTDP-4-dehydrorhamnose reductase